MRSEVWTSAMLVTAISLLGVGAVAIPGDVDLDSYVKPDQESETVEQKMARDEPIAGSMVHQRWRRR